MVSVAEGEASWDPATRSSFLDLRKYNFISIQPHWAVATKTQGELPSLCKLGLTPVHTKGK